MKLRTTASLSLALLLAATMGAQGHPPPRKMQVAEGVFLFITPGYGDVGMDGNAIAVVGRDGVLVFDSNGTPAAAAAVLAEVRKLTDRPVRYLVNSHWHWDHWYGAEIYAQAFPEIRIVTHEKTRELMKGPALEFNKPGLESQLPGYIGMLEKKLADARAKAPAAPETARLEALVAEDRFFLDQKKNVRHTLANVTFSDRLDVHLGDREIQVLHYGRAVTPGDAFLYLPKEKIVVTGDLLVNPISFALSCYPTEWLTTLEQIDKLDASVLIPGHGEPLRDNTLLHATMDVFRALLRQGKDYKSKGIAVDAAKAAILPGLEPLMVKITGNDPQKNQAFNVQLVDWYLHRVYDELDGKLTDEIASIPQK